MKALIIILTTTVAVAIAGAPAFIHSLHTRNVETLIGECSLDDIERLFQAYPSECNAVYESLSEALSMEEVDQAGIRAAYSTICSSACKEPMLDFREACQALQLTDRVIHACAQTSDQTACIVELFRNNGTEVVTKCRSVAATGMCNDVCRSAVQRFKADLGCCVNSLFNVSTYGFQIMNVSDYRLWSACGVDTPGYCAGELLSLSSATKSFTRLSIFSALLAVSFFMLMW